MKDFNLAEYLHDLEYIVNIDSGSRHPAGVAAVANFMAQRYEAMGWHVTRHHFNNAVGPCLEIKNTHDNDYDVLIIGHMDTVFPVGTVAERPFSIKDGRAYGPGVADMKAGLLLAYYALKTLQDEGKLQHAKICVALNSDEEISSVYSRPWLEQLAVKSRHAFIMEPARANGALVNQRKGLGRYSFVIKGKAAHAGVDPEKGRSAINELAHWILSLHALTNFEVGTTVNVGVVHGGTAANVVAEHAAGEIDIRFVTMDEAVRIEETLKELVANPRTEGVTASFTGKVTRPPMNPSPATLRLCQATTEIAKKHNIDISWVATGGGSDGNFTAALGVPTIDGLGPIGGASHSPSEYLEINSIEPRLNLLRELILYVAQ